MKAGIKSSVKIRLKVVPGSSREGWEWLGEDKSLLKIKVTAPPEKGKANNAVEKYLSRILGVPGNSVTITSGSTTENKIVEINGLTLQELRSKL